MATITLAEHLRALPDDGLAALLALRPDLVVPVPVDLSALAARAQSRVSVARALDPLDQFTLEILDALRLCRDGGVASVEGAVGLVAAGRHSPAAATVRAAVDRLRARFLVYGPESDLHLAAGVDEACSPYPAALGRPARDLSAEVAGLCADPAKLRRTVLAAPPAARAVLDRLAAGPPLGTVTAASIADPDTPVGWLIAHHLLVAVDDPGGLSGAVQLPREVGLLLRRDVGPLGVVHPEPPEIEPPVRSTRAVDSAGAGQALEVLRRTEALLDAVAAEPAPVLRSGGLGVRDLRRLSRAVGIEESEAAVLVEAAAAAGLLGETEPDSGGEARFLPTLGYEAWRAGTLAERWVRLARAWLLLTRQPALVGKRDERDRPLNALAPDLERIGAPRIRATVLGALADHKPGTAPTEEDLLDLLAWRAPRQFPTSRAEPVRWALSEAAVLGFTGLGALTGFGRLLVEEVLLAARTDLDEDPLGLSADSTAGSDAAAALDALLPAPVDHVVLQADLTMVVPGPAEPALATELALLADAESANLFRLTGDSLRRALDAGYTADDLHALFRRRSRTPVPQGLTYLIDDMARRHGGLRVGSAGAYLRSDDEALLVELIADRRLSALQLRRLAPTVLATPFTSTRLLAALRDAGYAPVPEDATGTAILNRPRARRAPVRRPPVSARSIVDGQPRLSAPRLAGIVEQLRRTDAATRAARRAPVAVRAAPDGTAAQAHAQAIAVLQQALRDKQRVWVGYVDAHGGTASRLVRPVSIGAGYLRAEDDRSETLHTFALHRITAAVLED